jgi:hypothetical protein
MLPFELTERSVGFFGLTPPTWNLEFVLLKLNPPIDFEFTFPF